MSFFEFSELNLRTGKRLKVLTFQAESAQEACENALYTAKLSNGYAMLGPTGKVVYPEGRNGDIVWVLSVPMPTRLGSEP